MPIDCIKTTMQKADASQQGLIPTIQQFYQAYGLAGYYVGWKAKLLQYLLNSAFTVALLERLRDAFTRL